MGDRVTQSRDRAPLPLFLSQIPEYQGLRSGIPVEIPEIRGFVISKSVSPALVAGLAEFGG